MGSDARHGSIAVAPVPKRRSNLRLTKDGDNLNGTNSLGPGPIDNG